MITAFELPCWLTGILHYGMYFEDNDQCLTTV